MLRIQNVLVPTDFSTGSERALNWALLIGREYRATIHALHVAVVSPSRTRPEGEKSQREDESLAWEALSRFAGVAETSGLHTTTALDSGDAAAPAIVHYSKANDIDLIVVGTHGNRAVKRIFLGSVAEELVRTSACPIVTVRERRKKGVTDKIDHVLVALDLSVHSRDALLHARNLALRFGATLEIVHVIQDLYTAAVYGLEYDFLPEMNRTIEAQVQLDIRSLVEDVSIDKGEASATVLQGQPAPVVVRHAADTGADLLVIASHGRTGLDHLIMGSVAEKIVRTASCPVMVIKSYEKNLLDSAYG